MSLPKAILFDLEDTLVNWSDTIAPSWKAACWKAADRLTDIGPERLLSAVQDVRLAEQEKDESLPSGNAYVEIAALAPRRLGLDDRSAAEEMAKTFGEERKRRVESFMGVRETLKTIKTAGVKTALITIGGREHRDRLLGRTGLAEYFDCVLLEGELGFGKPAGGCIDSRLKSSMSNRTKPGWSATAWSGTWKRLRRSGSRESGLSGLHPSSRTCGVCRTSSFPNTVI